MISIVTPVFNMAAYVRETVESVLSQDYPDIEYLVMDGGSTDGTLEILESYRPRLQYYSAPDGGAADAINRGFDRARGSILAWINADDIYLPGAVSAAVRYLDEHPEALAVSGLGSWVDADGQMLGTYPSYPPVPGRLQLDCCICQPTCFFRRSAFEAAGRMDVDLHCSFDYDLWIRLARLGPIAQLTRRQAASRMHPSNKTLRNRREVYRESFGVLRRHYGYVPFNWVYSYAVWLRDGRDQFYEPLHPSTLAYCLSLPIGFWENRGHFLRYVRDWSSVMTLQAFRRVLGGVLKHR